MAYKIETVRKLITTMNMVRKYWEKAIERGEKVELSISDGNDKIGKTINVSIAPILSCGNCEACMCTCYAVGNMIRRGMNTINAWVKNYVVLMLNRTEYFRQIREKIRRRRKNFYFRWHVSGDIIDADYFAEMVAIAKEFPHFKFWTYTKMHHIVNNYCKTHGGKDAIPKNLNIMFSVWGKEIANPYGFKCFIFVPKKAEHKPAGFYCPGNCDICKERNIGCVGYQCDVYVNEH